MLYQLLTMLNLSFSLTILKKPKKLNIKIKLNIEYLVITGIYINNNKMQINTKKKFIDITDQ